MYVQNFFEQQQAKTPHGIAVSFNNLQLSYTELNRRANILSNIILSKAAGEEIIGISATKNIEMVIGLLAILKAGKAYLPLDLKYPEERLKQIIKDSGINTCLASNIECDKFSALDLKTIATDKEYRDIDTPILKRSSIAYVLYTSGSTGVPKGVCVNHGSLINLLQWQIEKSVSKEGCKTLQFIHLSFDPSFQEIFVPLSTGGQLVLIDDVIRLNGTSLLSLIQNDSINRICLPYVALQYMAEAAVASNLYPPSLQEVVTGGEVLKITPQIAKFFSCLSDCALVNAYGPTEATICVTENKLKGNADKWPTMPTIGWPIANTSIFILDEELNLVANGKEGEICISGICLAEGYLHQPELTKEKFQFWKHPQKGLVRIYRTGDLARYLPDGALEFIGRIDDQVKIRGNRVELKEIEVVLTQTKDVGQAVVIAREDIPGQKFLAAYLVSPNGKEDTASVREAIKNKLPDFMMPSVFVWLPKLPTTTGGKVDRKALPKPELKRPELSNLYNAPSTEIEKIIAGIWTKLLRLDKVGVNDNFFELGGNSLLAVQTIAILQQDYGYQLQVTKLYQHPTIKQIALLLDGKINTSFLTRKNTKGRDSNDVAIIGMAGRFPGANTIEELWEILKAGKETTKFFTSEELDPSIPKSLKEDSKYIKARGIIDNAQKFDASFFGINTKLAELMDPQQRVFLEIAWEVLESTGHLPFHFDGTIGVYAGCGPNTYFVNNVLSHKELIERNGSFQVTTVNDKDYISSRTAYSLNLKGPAVTVQSACSTSLLAIAQAVEAIRNNQCDIALAGGVAITAPINSGHLYQEGAIFSADGHCRPFDADAKGTIFSDGAGVVLLKSKDRAVADGDTIYALIKGVGISNDGSDKGSFTAPSTEGQAAAISMAMQDAGIAPSEISYIEAHGTATPLGDPIEIEGLKLAFGPQQKKQYCAIGSIKSNMGHLTIAAGVAGAIKTALALHYKQLPASIHFKSPNPEIDFTNSPFFVNNQFKEWKTENKRIAGVSSFGVGGTNVHIILEETETIKKESSIGRPSHLISWSAKTEKSTEDYREKLLDYLSKNKDVNIADLTYTLNLHRQDFNHRRFLVASSTAELIERLNSKTHTGKTIEHDVSDIVFMFPGQGSQHINMAKELYHNELVFKNAIDECAALLNHELQDDIRLFIYPDKTNTEAEERLKNTRYAQPSLFVIEYAIARLWMSWGIQPSFFIGHSIGEFVAAHFAGIFSLKDALRLIAARGKMMSELPKGSMLSVRIQADKLKILLPDTLSIAAINSPELCVVAGPDEAIQAFSKELEKTDVVNRLLHTSHAFHSAMMQPVVEPFEGIIKTISLHPPRIPIVSTVTGNWLTDAEAIDPHYWANHLRTPVLFSEAIKTSLAGNAKIFLETGPKNITATLTRQQLSGGTSIVLASLDLNEKTSDYESILKTLGQLWINGVRPDWTAFYASQKRVKLTLPNYAFDRKLYWVDPLSTEPKQTTANPEVPKDLFQTQIVPIENTVMRKTVLVEKLKKIIEDTSGVEMQSIATDMNFIEIGLDSLLLTQIALVLKKEFSLPISFRQLNEEYSNLDSLSGYLDQNLPVDKYRPISEPAIAVPGNNQTIPPAGLTPKANTATSDSALGIVAQQLQLLAKQVALLQNNSQPAALLPQEPITKPVLPAIDNGLKPEEEKEIKKPFGAIARIEKQSSELSPKQRAFLDKFILKYTKKTAKSKLYTQKFRDCMADPRVVSGFKPVLKEMVYSIVANKSQGCRLWDIDNNEYIDVLSGFGSNFLGYQNDSIKKALHKQIDNGFEVGPQHELAGEVSKLICEFTGFDRVALCNTGSEAVLGAIRIARTVTGKSTIVAFTGSYHGIVDEVLVRGTKKLKTFPGAPGIMPEAVQNMLILDYGTEESLRIIKERAHELAAILVEPVQSRRPEFQPVEFLKELRALTDKSGAALIFDEVITGFRVHPGGVQALFGIKADLATYGKVVGGGMSVGVIAGKKQFMDALDGGHWKYGDSSIPEVGVTYFAGTFVRHPLALAATKGSLEYMKEKGPSLQESVSAKTKRLVDSLNMFCEGYGLPLIIVRFGSLWRLKFTQELPYSELLTYLMRFKGVHIVDPFSCFLTEAHTEKDIDSIIEIFKSSVDELIEAEFLPSSLDRSMEQKAHGEEPPIPGARSGRDASGKPAWFINDPNRPGKYLQLNFKN